MRSLKEIAGKSVLTETQLEQIESLMLRNKYYSPETIRQEIDWFCTGLGMPEYYFQTTPIETITGHIEAIKAAEIMSAGQAENNLKLDLARELENEAIYLVDDYHTRALEVERRIEGKYPDGRLQTYRTLGKAMGVRHLRMYLVYNPRYTCEKSLCDETDLKKIACPNFLKSTTKQAYNRYQKLIQRSYGWETPLIDVTIKKDTNEHRIMVVTNSDSSSRFFSNVSDVLNSYHFVSNRKYIEPFANGKTVYSFYIDRVENEEVIRSLVEDISLLYVIPESPLSHLFREGRLNAHETVFGTAAWSFTHQFLTGYNEEYMRLSAKLRESPELLGMLRELKTRLSKDTFDESKVWDALLENHSILKKLFTIFDKKFNPFRKDHNIDEDITAITEEIKHHIVMEIDRDIFMGIILFIQVIQRTNFYKNEKTSISFLYEPKFLNPVDYPEVPYGIIHVIAREMRGFHIRFRDISRGGIRIVRSGNYQQYLNNSDFIFDENYNLAYTQQKKNKDIPEGGAKGTILLRWGYQEKAATAFKKYINGLLDLMMPDGSFVDYSGRELLLFLGPDEGTADLMEWASLRARVMDYPYWQAFSTGKPVSMGGIPHDLYGMTTNSVHQFVLNILKKNNILEKNITKVMTGGPDGDLGSNEILLSKDVFIAIIDGSGVLYDPEGIDRKELKKLALKRKMVEDFNRKVLSSKGFFVHIKDRNVFLPGGEKVASGMEFRNTFHLNPKFKADLFVPCGGRPASININNWKQFLDEKGNPRVRFIVEGANLFLTQEARLRFEEKGVIIFKDASANKGGVTSSSMEVFASLALSDKEYEEYMCVRNGVIPDFRKAYVSEIIDLIKANSTSEFEIIWKEHEAKGIPRSILTDKVSEKINKIGDAVYASALYSNRQLFEKVIACCCPSVLIDTIGMKKILERVPDSYLNAIFASRLASRYVYTHGLDADEVDFFNFIQTYI
ncbi:MAG: NAD-glutamate dehydrogenase [Acidobacteria bacterium]|nr:NAD-glutamate dehydrogenase [Acidobacteriota bacterium]